MAKITSKASLVMGTNLKLHIADKGGTDIAINDNADGTGTITSSTTDFVASSESSGIVNKPIVVGDRVTLSHTGEAANEGMQVDVTAVSANSISYDDVAGALTDESAGADINLVAFKKTYQFLEAGGLSFVDGVMGIVLTSKLVDLWDVNDLDKYKKPFTSIEPRAKSLASINGWEAHDSSTLYAIRDTALEYRDTATSSARKIFGWFLSSSLHAVTDQYYFWSENDSEMTAPQAAVTAGYINQVFEIYDVDGADNRGVWFTRCAEAGKTIVMEQRDANYAELYPVSAANAIDPKLGDGGGPFVSDVTIAAGGIYANVEYNSDVDGVYEGDVDGTDYDFDGYWEGDNQVNEVAHAKVNWSMRQPTNINADGAGSTFRGDKQWPMSAFSGEVFTVQMYLLNYKASQRNNLRVVDNTGNTRQWPTSITLSLIASALLIGGTFTIWHADTYGTSAAVVFQNEDDTEQQDITIQALLDIVMAYSSYNVDGHTPGTSLDVIISFNRPGYVESGIAEMTLDGTNKSVTFAPTADPSYTAA